MKVNSLTELKCKNAKFADKPYKLTDGQGLYLYVTSRSKIWRRKYYYLGQEKVMVIGPYPAISLASARQSNTEIMGAYEKR